MHVSDTLRLAQESRQRFVSEVIIVFEMCQWHNVARELSTKHDHNFWLCRVHAVDVNNLRPFAEFSYEFSLIVRCSYLESSIFNTAVYENHLAVSKISDR